MLLPLLLLTSTMFLQDGSPAATPRPAQDAGSTAAPTEDPETAPAAAADSAAPAVTSEKVRSFLLEAEAQLYDPKTSGLTSLGFDLPIDFPQLGNLGTAHVTWNTDGAMDIKVDRAADAGSRMPPGLPAEAIDQAGRQAAQQLLQTMLNHPISPMLEAFVATMDGVEDGLVKVSFSSPEAAAQGFQQAFYFDDENRLQKVTMAGKQMGMSVTQTQRFTWKPSGVGDSLVLESEASEADLGLMKQKSVVTFTRRTVGEIILTTGIITTVEGPPPMGGTQALAAKNLVVNGQPVADEGPASVPAPAQDPAGG